MKWIFYSLLSALFAAMTAILAKVGIKGVNSDLATAVRTIVIVLFAWGVVAAQGTIKQVGQISKFSLVFLVLSGITTGLSWIFYFRALQAGNASQVAPIDKLSLVITVILAVIFLKEKVTASVAFGVLLVSVGTIIIGMGK